MTFFENGKPHLVEYDINYIAKFKGLRMEKSYKLRKSFIEFKGNQLSKYIIMESLFWRK